MDFSKTEIFYFLGIGGIGMSALARYFHVQDRIVMGYDKTSTPLTTELVMEGIEVHFDDSILEIPQVVKLSGKEKVIVVYTPAIPKDSIEFNWLKDQGYVMMKRSQVLGLVTANSKTIAVGGTHGKTTTSCLIAHILEHAEIGCNAFLGGISSNYNTNLLLSKSSPWTVVEADEYDRSFLALTPTVSIITSMDADHLDIYGTHQYMLESFQLFAERAVEGGKVIFRKDLPLVHDNKHFTNTTYSISERADHEARNIRVVDGEYLFDLYTNGGPVAEALQLGLPGRHNVENAVAACAAVAEAGVDGERLRSALASFKGVKRRFEYHIRRNDMVLIDDYAHHPEELRACISSVRELYPGLKITGVFQPHLFSRTRDFADDFARSLAMLDDIILLPIYPARELPMEGVHSQMLLDKIPHSSKILVEKSGLLAELSRTPREVVVMLGAGDIDALVPKVARAFSGN